MSEKSNMKNMGDNNMKNMGDKSSMENMGDKSNMENNDDKSNMKNMDDKSNMENVDDKSNMELQNAPERSTRGNTTNTTTDRRINVWISLTECNSGTIQTLPIPRYNCDWAPKYNNYIRQ